VALSGTQWHSVALSGTRRSGAGQAAPACSIQGTQGSSEVIRGHPRPSESLMGHPEATLPVGKGERGKGAVMSTCMSLMGHPEATLPVAAGRAQGAFDGASRAQRSEAPYGSVARASPERACPPPPTHPPRRSVARGPRGASLPVGRGRRGEPLHARRAQLNSRVSPRELAFSAACASILAIATGLPSFRKALAARVYSPARLRHEAA
jgi:hypothetical protein